MVRLGPGREEAAAVYSTEEDRDADFHPTEEDTWEEAYATWQAEIARARVLAAAADSLDERSRGRSRGQAFTLRWIYIHMIEEYARHNGHADLLRERIDGATGE